jgi:hypothetical protein
MLLKADEEIKQKFADTAKRCADEEMRLAAASKETAKFIEVSQAIMRKHSEFLEKLEAARRTIGPKGSAGQAAQEQSAAKAGKAPKAAQQTRSAPPPAVKPVVQPVHQPQPAQPVHPVPPPQMQPMPPVQSAQPVQPVQPPLQQTPPMVQHTQPMVQDQATIQIQSVTPIAVNDIEIDDIAMQIGSAVERLTEVDVTPIAPPPTPPPDEVRPLVFDEPPASLFEDDDDSVRLYTPESELEDTSPRPKFDFDDLKFGANFDTDD